MKFGTIGAGAVALAFGREALARGHEVVLSSRRGPAALVDTVAELGRGASAASVEEAASLDYVLLAVPWRNVESALKSLPAWNGRVLIDATNPFVETSPKLVLADLGGKGASEVVAALAPGARIVKAFNSIVTARFNEGPVKNGGRRVIFVSGDHPEPTAFIKQLIESFGFTAIDLGDLATGGRLRPPWVVGNEGLGGVLPLGRGVAPLKAGDRVLVPLYSFSGRERLFPPAAGLFALPEADPRQLAMLGINPPTAALLLNESIDLRPGDWVAQNAANSGVGRSLIAIAKARGLKTLNFVRRPELVPELQAVGGDLVIVDQSGALDKIRATIGDARVPLGIDGVAGEASATIAGVLSESGTVVVYALMSGKSVTIAPFDLIAKRVVVKGFFLNHPDVELKIPSALRETAPLVASGVIRVPIAATFRLTAFREAVAHVQRGGKVMFDVEGGI